MLKNFNAAHNMRFFNYTFLMYPYIVHNMTHDFDS